MTISPAEHRPPVRTCTFHCTGCQGHFHSLAAFDYHRTGDHAIQRLCVDPGDVVDRDGNPRLSAHAGLCRLARGGPLPDVEIWSERRSVERAAEAFRQAELEKAA